MSNIKIGSMVIANPGETEKTITGDSATGFTVTCSCGNVYSAKTFTDVPLCPKCEADKVVDDDPMAVNSVEIKTLFTELENLRESGCDDVEEYLKRSNKILALVSGQSTES